jgi:DNA repair exonuclease SbcCD ATPase subunit
LRSANRLKSILSKAISVLVIMVNLALITFIWIVQDDLSNSVVIIFTETDNITQVLRNGIARVEPELLGLRDLIRQIEIDSQEIAQNVSEEGIIPRLLPETIAESLSTSSQSLQDNFIAVYDLLEASASIFLALDHIPFIEIPENGLRTIATLQDSMEDIIEQAESLKTNIGDVRTEKGARISRLTDGAAFLAEKVDQFLSDLNQIDRDLDTIQTSIRKYQRLTPPVILSSAILISLLSAWVVYSQVNIIYQSGNHNREKINDNSEHPEHPPDEGHQI